MKYRRFVTLLCLLPLILSGCGFQLKGSQVGASNVAGANDSLNGQVVWLASSQPRSLLSAALAQQLTNAGVRLDEGDSEPLLLKLGEEQFEQRNLSLTAQARSAEVELTMRSRISVTRGNRTLLEPTLVSVTRQFYNDPRNVVGKAEELDVLRTEMRAELAAQITRRLEYSLGN